PARGGRMPEKIPCWKTAFAPGTGRAPGWWAGLNSECRKFAGGRKSGARNAPGVGSRAGSEINETERPQLDRRKLWRAFIERAAFACCTAGLDGFKGHPGGRFVYCAARRALRRA